MDHNVFEMQRDVKFVPFLIVIVDSCKFLLLNLLQLQKLYLQEGTSAFLPQNSLSTVYESSILVCLSLQSTEDYKVLENKARQITGKKLGDPRT